MAHPALFQRPHVQLHLAVFLFGFTAILGKLITLGGFVLVLYRVGIAAIGFAIWLAARRHLKLLPLRDTLRIVSIGLVLTVHWITFFQAIKMVGASITLICLASATLITALLEPLITRRRFVQREVLLGLVVLAGIYMIYEVTPPEDNLGILVALASAFLSALIGILNKTIVDRYEGLTINFWQMLGSFCVLLLALPLAGPLLEGYARVPTPADWGWLALLGLLCTVYAYQLAIRALKKLTAFQMILAINLEPLYGIVLATLFLHENRDLTPGLAIGMVLVLGAVFFNAGLAALKAHRLRKKHLR